MRRLKVRPDCRRHVVSLDVGWRVSSCLLPIAFGVLLSVGVVSVCRSRSSIDEAGAHAADAPRPASVLVTVFSAGPREETLLFHAGAGRFVEWSRPRDRVVRKIDLREGREADVTDVAVSADATSVAAGFADGMVVVRRNGRSVPRARGNSPVVALACSANGEYTASADRTSLALGASESGRVLWQRRDPCWDVLRLVFADGAPLLVALHTHGLVQVWDVPAARLVRTFHIPGSFLVAVDPGGRTLATADHGGNLCLRDIVTGKRSIRVRSPAEPLNAATALAFSPDGRLLACGRTSGRIELRHVADGARAAESSGHAGIVGALRFSDGGRLFSSGGDAAVRVWDLAHHEELECIDLSGALRTAGDH